MINQQIIEGHWNELKGRVQEKWGELSDDDIRVADGNLNQLVGVIQRKTGQARERIEAELEDLAASSSSFIGATKDTIRGMGRQASRRAHDGYDQVSGRVREGYNHAQTTVQDRPAESVAIAFGTGLIAGVIVALVLRSR
jgi:uncharacterized protein YjbJ (UPF0337 family)